MAPQGWIATNRPLHLHAPWLRIRDTGHVICRPFSISNPGAAGCFSRGRNGLAPCEGEAVDTERF
jgi:hypothetical protein